MPKLTRREALGVLLAAPSWRPQAFFASSESAVEAALQRIAQLDPQLRAFVSVTADRARADARASDAARVAGPARPLEGMLIAHKDLFETAGIRTTAGSALYDDYVPARDATLVARLAAAGTVLLGKTNTHELGGGVTTINPFFGTTRNPWDRTRIAGGSSGGSAAAVAAGLVEMATGSDTGGSVRIPAAFCGCVGFKPTFGRVSTAGLLGASPTFDHSGFLARSVSTIARVYREVAGYDSRDAGTVLSPPHFAPSAPLRSRVPRVRVGIARNFFFDRLQPAVARAMAAAVDVFTRAGADVREVVFPIDEKTMARVFDPIIVSEIHERFARDWAERPRAFSPGFAGFFQAPVPGGLALAAAYRALRDFQQQVRALFEEIDVVLTPTVAVTAPPISGPIEGALILRNTWPFNAARTPAISLPCGVEDGLPIGLQLAAAPFEDELLLEVAHMFERATTWHQQRPPGVNALEM